ncbi:ROK family transcriptional regulator [Devosia sp. BSSL-BM10]|jgi:predicted NBD/HSP70 family sugar kinase|uniref:ROK family transcriptional regulator n=1 Tax=Devosia litorisediminis TaxID=2829817 RepID=A0A942E3B2_9HYPH|nr:ROK family transcriptional regulator [Devosia litorisediminis]MBS3847458.1 ROK family transcriptional regulator [Devosia litorisediminis]
MVSAVTRGVGSDQLSRGTNQTGVRLYNERLVLSLVRRHGSLPKADIARRTGLSPQTISTIVNALEADGILLRLDPLRGKVGQPLVPYALNPRGAFFLGLKVGRRSSDIVLMDFVGTVLGRIHYPHPYPTPEIMLALTQRGIDELTSTLSPTDQQRIAGFGIASPFELWNWESQLGAPADVLAAWRKADIRAEIAAISHWPVYFHNDGTAACAAELVLGNGQHGDDFLYVFLGSFIGGGVVLNSHLFPGRTGYGGAIAPLPVPAPGGGFQQLLRSASIYVLADRLTEQGRDPAVLWRDPSEWGDIGPALDHWIHDAAQSLAIAAVSAVSIIDFRSVVIDGAFPPAVRQRLVQATRDATQAFDLQGLAPFTIAEGTIGFGAREIGGACLPLLANFTQDREVLFKENS